MLVIFTMQKFDKTIIFFVGLFLIVGLMGEILFYFDITQYSNITQTATAIGRIGGLILLISHGTLIRVKLLFQLILVFLDL